MSPTGSGSNPIFAKWRILLLNRSFFLLENFLLLRIPSSVRLILQQKMKWVALKDRKMKLLFLAAFVQAQNHDQEAMAFCNNYCQDKPDIHYPDTGFCLNGTYLNPKGDFFQRNEFQCFSDCTSYFRCWERGTVGDKLFCPIGKLLDKWWKTVHFRSCLERRVQDLRLAIQSRFGWWVLRALEINNLFSDSSQ